MLKHMSNSIIYPKRGCVCQRSLLVQHVQIQVNSMMCSGLPRIHKLSWTYLASCRIDCFIILHICLLGEPLKLPTLPSNSVFKRNAFLEWMSYNLRKWDCRLWTARSRSVEIRLGEEWVTGTLLVLLVLYNLLNQDLQSCPFHSAERQEVKESMKALGFLWFQCLKESKLPWWWSSRK